MIFLNELADEMNSEIIIITETHLRNNQDEAESNIPGWSETRADRKVRSHGGVNIYTRDYIPIQHQLSYSNGHLELACTFISSYETAIISMYRPPDCPAKLFSDGINKAEEWINSLETKLEKTPTIILAGDLNFPNMKTWSPEDISRVNNNFRARTENDIPIGSEREQITKLIDMANKRAFSQEVEVTTRGENTLDLIFCNNTEFIDSIESIENTTMSDHKFLIAHMTKDAEAHEEQTLKNFCHTKIPEFNLKTASPEEWKQARNVFLKKSEDFNLEASANDIINETTKALEDTVIQCFSSSKVPDRSKLKSNSLIPREARTLMRKKINASKTLQKSEDPDKINNLKDKIAKIEDDLRKLVHRKRSIAEKKARNNLKTDPKPLYQLVKKLTRKPSKIGPLNRTKTTESWSDAKILSQQYKSVFTAPMADNIFTDSEEFFHREHTEDSNTKLDSFTVNKNLIYRAIDKLSPDASPGPDGIPSILIKQLKFEITPTLEVAFKKSIENGEIPKNFSQAYIKPIKKPKKPRGDPASYRPVSLTSNVAKILEHLVKSQLQNHLEQEEKLNTAQHGFRPNRSCLTQLLDHYDTVLKHLEEGRTYEVIYLDFAKAFDTVDRYILARELLKIGIQNKAATWLFQFLNNRTQQVLAENTLSPPVEVISGVPQGTVLGPQMFLILINSMTEEEIESKVTMFADDTRVGRDIINEDDIAKLQRDLDTIFSWQKRNNMSFNEDKFELVIHGNNLRYSSSIPRGRYITDDGTVIKPSTSVRDLGIQISEDNDFSEQIAIVCKRARDKANWVFRTFYSRDVSFMTFMWRCYVQPLLDYGSQLWTPSSQGEIKALEDIFRNYSNRAQQDNKESFDFWNRIRRYGIRSQQRRAERFRIICTWKVLERITPNCGLSWSSTESSGRLCKVSHSPNYSTDRVKTLRNASFQSRGPALFNVMPYFLRETTNCSINVFKNKLDKFLETIPDTPLSQKWYPIPLDCFSARPSNGLIDWIRHLGVPVRHPLPLEEVKNKIKSSPQFIDFEHSRFSPDPRLTENSHSQLYDWVNEGENDATYQDLQVENDAIFQDLQAENDASYQDLQERNNNFVN